MSIPYVPQDCRIGMAVQSTWGTAVADNAAVIQLDVPEPIDFEIPMNMKSNPGATGARWRIASDYSFDQHGVASRFTIQCEAKQDELDIFLYAFTQKVVEGASTPSSKVFTFDTSAPQPDFSADAGFKLTFFFRDAVDADSLKIKDVICERLKLTAMPGQRTKMEAKMIGRGIPVASTPSGTWTRSANLFYNWDLFARKTINFGAGAVAQVLGSGGVVIDLIQSVIPHGQEVSGGIGYFSNYTIKDRYPKYSIKVIKGTSLGSAITNFKAGTQNTFVLGQGNATAGTDDGDLDFTFGGIFTPGPSRIFAEHYEVDMAGDMVSANSSTTPLTITLANATDRSW